MSTLSEFATDDRTARVALSLVGTPNDPTTGRLLEQVGAVELIKLVGMDGSVPGMDDVATAVWRDRMRSATTPESLATRISDARSFRVIIPSDPDWPAALNDLGDRTPYALWAKGRTELLSTPISQRVTITGARAATSYGAHVTEELCDDLTTSGKTLVAGAAYGIDGSVHQAALRRGGDTIAVLASGIDRPYPMGHADLLERVGNRGLTISEVPPGTAPTRQRFLDRARILGALSGTTVVVEAGARSGTLRIAQEAAELGRRVGAVPGPVTSAASAGANSLLQQGMARVVTNGHDVIDLEVQNRSAPERMSIHQGAPRVASQHSRVL